VITPQSKVEVVFGRSHAKRKRVVEGLGIETVGQLLMHFPRRYQSVEDLTEVDRPEIGQHLSVIGEVVYSEVKTFHNRATNRRGHRTEVRIKTGGPTFSMSFFTPYAQQAEKDAAEMAVGERGMFSGTVRMFNNSLQLDKPQRAMLTGSGGQALAESMTGLMPIYPVTSGLYSWDLQKVIQLALSEVSGIAEVLPEEIRKERGLLDVMTALRWIHGPDDWQQLGAAQKRFRFQEALVTQLVLARRRTAIRAEGARARTGGGGLLAAFDARLPFELTAGQREIGEQLEEDLAQSHPMHRLLQGEVGSGKTLVALRAMLRVVDSGGQAALLAPTEVLAQQHHTSITRMLGDLAAGGMLGGAADATRVALLTGSMSTAQRRETMLHIASGEAGLVIGTHALLEERVTFADLGLVVVDEQHRFGVEQRAALTDKAGVPPHVLVMTATPIPRTVAMTVFGDLETSVLTELPAGRAPIQTTVVPLAEQPSWLDRAWARVREEVEAGHQVYVVCPRITGDEKEQGEQDTLEYDEDGNPLEEKGALTAVTELAPSLASGPLTGLRVEMLHGRMPADEKDRTMRAFAGGEIDVLVATTVSEVGVDVANATAMVLMDADRFGVSQLHQLRGRVGRGGLPGLCLLVTRAEAETPARERLAAVASTTDGFELSLIDLEQRREGDVLGVSQSGLRSSLQTLRVLRDEDTIVAAREVAVSLLERDPSLKSGPGLAVAVNTLEQSGLSEFLEKS
jgi:ATP-dependent DNA helicase RecG